MRERLTADDRGVSEVVGAILIFGLLVVLLSIFQTQVVPVQNQEVELKHSTDVQDDLLDFHQTASEVAADGNSRSVSIRAGTGYPSRLLFINPPQVQGTVSTTSSANVEIRNIEATDPDVDEYIKNSAPGAPTSNVIQVETRRMQYQVNYNELQDEPTIRYEYGVLYNQFESGGLTVQNEGNIIDGDNINVLSLEGEYSESSTESQSIGVQPVSAPARTVSISDDGSGNIVLFLPSNLAASEWRQIYDPSSVSNIQSISSAPGGIEIELAPGDYNLRLPKVSLDRGVTQPDPSYIVPVDPGSTTTSAGEEANIEYEVRDRFNNPVSGVQVEITKPTPTGTTVVATKTTDSTGRVTVSDTPAATKDYTAAIDLTSYSTSCSGNGECEADYTVQVPRLPINSPEGVVVQDSSTGDTIPPVPTSLEDNTIQVVLENTGPSNANIEQVRINHYSPDPNSRSPVDLRNSPTGPDAVDDIVIGGEFNDSSNSNIGNLNTITSGSTEEFYFVFDDSVSQGHWFVLTVIYDTDERALYFVSPEGSPTGGGGGPPPGPPSP